MMAEEEGEKVKENPNTSLGKAAIKNFCEASTIHGISSIFLAKSFITRLFWIGMFVSVCTLLFYEVLQLVKKFNSNDVVMTSRRVSESKLEFPVVILSNADPYSKAKLMEYPQRSNGTGKVEHLRDILSSLSSKKALELGSNLNVLCRFGGVPCWALRQAFPWVGNSFQFNGYFRWKQKAPGPENGLEMTLLINESDYSNAVDNGQGVLINIGKSGFITRSLQRNKGILVAPGTLTKINMKKKKIIRLPYPYPDNCEKETDIKELKGFHFKYPLDRVYSLDFCRFVSLLRNQMIFCGVVDPEYKFIIESYLLMEKSNVSFDISGNSSETENIRICLKKVVAESFRSDCRCPCVDELFDFTVSHLRWPSSEEAREKLSALKKFGPNANRYQNWTLDTIYKNMLKVEIYFSDFDIEVIEQKPAYRLVEFASDMGGQIGLWIGASVYSAFEVLTLLASLGYYLFRLAFIRGFVNGSRSRSTHTQDA